MFSVFESFFFYQPLFLKLHQILKNHSQLSRRKVTYTLILALILSISIFKSKNNWRSRISLIGSIRVEKSEVYLRLLEWSIFNETKRARQSLECKSHCEEDIKVTMHWRQYDIMKSANHANWNELIYVLYVQIDRW